MKVYPKKCTFINIYALGDSNNFYASCERVFNPNLEQKPVAILSNNNGGVISMSHEAKELQLPFDAPIFKWDGFCKAHNISVVSSNYSLYGDMSARVMKMKRFGCSQKTLIIRLLKSQKTTILSSGEL